MNATLATRSSAAAAESTWTVDPQIRDEPTRSSAFADDWQPLTEQITIRIGEKLAQAPWIENVLDDLRSAVRLTAGWNSHGERPIHPASAKRVIDILNRLEPTTPRPHVVPLASGALQLEWHGPSLSIEVEVPPSGSAEGFAYPSDDREGDEVEWTVAKGRPNDDTGVARLTELLVNLAA